ncbi:MAG: 50S ribosomal protein L14 [Candidatus Aenigmatarchaeota archaeon]|nr:MAG: 50S ribosomal protein L14 [Candidatus Aenigmarchaeota archaeon]
MKGISAKISKCLPVGSYLVCADNSGAKELQIISVRSVKSRLRRRANAGVADVVTCRVSKGNEQMRHQVVKAVIIRQKKPWKRPNGLTVAFEDNAAVLVDDRFEPKASLIRGPVAKEVVERFPAIGKLASMIV